MTIFYPHCQKLTRQQNKRVKAWVKCLHVLKVADNKISRRYRRKISIYNAIIKAFDGGC